MPIDPMTGQANYGPQAMQTPLAFDLLESIPGITTVTMVNMGRYANTLMKRW